MKNVNPRYVIAAIILWPLAFIGSLLLFPEWTKSPRSIVFLILTSGVGSIAFIATLRQAIERPPLSKLEEHFPNLFRDRISAQKGYLSQLPPVTKDFVGRKIESAVIQKAVLREGCESVGIFGMGGIGKTSLASKIGHELKSKYLDGQIVVEMMGSSNNPLDAEEGMKEVLFAHDPSLPIPESSGQIHSIYNSLLAGKKEILLFDDVSDRSQVERLIPPAGNLLIVTSRQHLTLPGMKRITLGSLSHEDAKELIISIAPRTEGVEDEIAEACSDHPLALRILASAIAIDPSLRPEEYLRRLRHGLEKQDEVMASLELSYQLLPLAFRPIWISLAVFPGDFNKDAAFSITGQSKSSIDEALSTFVRMSILQIDSVSGRYKMHDLLREHATDKLVSSERSLLVIRFSNHFLEFVHEMNNLYHQGGEHTLDALQQIDMEWHNIKAARNFFVTLGKVDHEIATIGAKFVGLFIDILDVRLRTEEEIDWIKDSLACAKLTGDDRDTQSNLTYLGNTLCAHGDCEEAIAIHTEALRLANKLKDPSRIAISLTGLGNAHLCDDNPYAAVNYLSNAYKLTIKIGDRRGEGHCSRNLGSVYLELGDLDKAEELLENGLLIAEEFNDPVGKSYTLNNLGLVYLDREDEKTAMEYFERALEIKIKVGDRDGQVNTMVNIAQILGTTGKEEQAIQMLAEAKQVAKSGSPRSRKMIEDLAKKIEEE